MITPDSSVGTATDYELSGRVLLPGSGTIFLSSTASRPVLGHNPASYLMGTGGSLPEGCSGWCIKMTTHLNLVPRSRMVDLYLHSVKSLHGVNFALEDYIKNGS
jgi:hypothetical protein